MAVTDSCFSCPGMRQDDYAHTPLPASLDCRGDFDAASSLAMRHKRTIIMSGLVALCGLALLVQHVSELGSNFTGDHLVAGIVLLAVAVLVWFLPSEAK
jgi:hypothetical protein